MYYVYIYIGTHSAPFCSRCGKAVKCQDQRCITVWSVFGSAFCKQLQILQTSGPLSLARLYTRALHRTKLSWHTPTKRRTQQALAGRERPGRARAAEPPKCYRNVPSCKAFSYLHL